MNAYHHREDRDGDNEREDNFEEWGGEERRHTVEKRSQWDFSPQTVSTILGVLSILGASVWGFSNVRVTLETLNQRMNIMSERMNDSDKRLTEIDLHGSRPLATTEATIKNLQDEIDDLKQTTKELTSSFIQHNDMTVDLYKRSIHKK